MRTSLMLTSVLLLGSAFPAAAQDIVVTHILQRLCIPAVTKDYLKDEDVAPVAQALGLTRVNFTVSGIVHGDNNNWHYSLAQPGGTYNVYMSRWLGGSSCNIHPPASIPKAQMEQAATQAAPADWIVAFGTDGPVWTKSIRTAPRWGHDLVLKIDRSLRDDRLYVSVDRSAVRP